MSTLELPSPEERSQPVAGPMLLLAFQQYFGAIAEQAADSISQVTYAAHEIEQSEAPYAHALKDSAYYYTEHVLGGELPDDPGDLILRAPIQSLCYSGLLVSQGCPVREAARIFDKRKLWLQEVITSARNDLLAGAEQSGVRAAWNKRYINQLSRAALDAYAQ